MYCTECIVSKFQRKILKIKCKLRVNRNKFQAILIRFVHTIRFLPYTFIRSLIAILFRSIRYDKIDFSNFITFYH